MERIISFSLGNIWRWSGSPDRSKLIRYLKTLDISGVEIVFDEFTFSINSAQVQQNDEVPVLSIDRKAIFPVLNLTVKPSINDRIVDPDSVIWRVIGIGGDPMDAHHSLHIRPIG